MTSYSGTTAVIGDGAYFDRPSPLQKLTALPLREKALGTPGGRARAFGFVPVLVAMTLSFPVLGAAADTNYDLEVQQLLADRGCDPGMVDGKWGRRSNEALSRFLSVSKLEVQRPFSEATLAMLKLSDVSCPLPEPNLNYKRTASLRLDFGGPASEAPILDVADLNGDGADDFAISAGGRAEATSDVKPIKLLKSYLVQSDTDGKKLTAVDLGEGGLTARTWAGRFVRDAGGAWYLALGRNGELYLPEYNSQETGVIFRIGEKSGNLTAETVLILDHAANTASVDACDFDDDGTVEIYFNNYGPPSLPRHDIGAPSLLQLGNGSVQETTVLRFISFLTSHGALNVIRFQDLDADGDCDLLGALEVARWDTYSDTVTFPGDNESFVELNENGTFGAPILIPESAFGDDNAATSILATRQGGANLVFVSAGEFKSHLTGENGFALRVYEFSDGTFRNVTSERIDGELPLDVPFGSIMRLADIDRDGDEDIYFGTQLNEVGFLRNVHGVFRFERLLDLPGGRHWVAFLDRPDTKCLDFVATIRQDERHAEIRRYGCL